MGKTTKLSKCFIAYFVRSQFMLRTSVKYWLRPHLQPCHTKVLSLLSIRWASSCTEMPFLQISPYSKLLSHSRFLLTLRSSEGKYHSLILFRLSSGNDLAQIETEKERIDSNEDVSSSDLDFDGQKYKQIYAMESTCPHLGADSQSHCIAFIPQIILNGHWFG